MKKFDSAKQRMVYFLKNQGITRNKFYELSGMSNGSLDTDGGLNEVNLLKIVEVFPELSLDWLLLEKGSMMRQFDAKNVNVTSSPQSNVANGDMKIEAQAELVAIIAKQQDTIDRLTITVDKLLQNK